MWARCEIFRQLLELDQNLFHKLLVIVFDRLKLHCAHLAQKIMCKMKIIYLEKKKRDLAASVCFKRCV